MEGKNESLLKNKKEAARKNIKKAKVKLWVMSRNYSVSSQKILDSPYVI